MHRALGAGVFAIGVLLGSTAISSAQVVLVRGNDTDPATLDHHKTSTISESRVLNDLYDGLISQDASGNLIPGAAKSWEISEDGRTYTFKLRPDGKWSNGDPVTSDDFLFAFQRIMDPATAAGYASILFPISNAEAVSKGEMTGEDLGVAAPDPQTLVITLNDADALFPAASHPPDRQAAASRQRGEVRRPVHQAGQPGDQRRLHAGELRSERQDRPEEEPQLLRRRQRARSTRSTGSRSRTARRACAGSRRARWRSAPTCLPSRWPT